jgi:hypothetical protein
MRNMISVRFESDVARQAGKAPRLPRDRGVDLVGRGEVDGYVGLAVLEAPPVAWEPAAVGLCWVDGVSQLPERIGPRAQTWLDEWAGRTAPPPLRPRWSRPGWSDRATRWIDSALAGRGRRGIGPVEMRRLWGISALARIPHDTGRVAWFKAVFPHFHHEPAVTRHLGRLVPGLVPPILATDVDEGWLLMDDAGAPLHDDDDAATLAAIGPAGGRTGGDPRPARRVRRARGPSSAAGPSC